MAHDFLTRKKGFTLLELLIVIAIIGILVAVGVVSYAQAQKKTRNSRRRSDIKALQSAWEQYYADYSGTYPYLAGSLPNCPAAATVVTYLPAGYPVDPKDATSYLKSCATASYCFCALLEGETGNADATCNYSAATKNYFCATNLQ